MNQPKSITDDAIVKATGKTWQQWFAILDKEGAVKLPHKEIVILLFEKGHLENHWWRQTVTVEYEKARGKRVLGETCDAGFQVGVQKSLPITADNLWALLTKPAGRAIWLGKLPRLRFAKGQNYKTADGTRGEIRSIDEGKKIRLTWQPRGRDEPTTLQLNLLANGENTSLHFHHEKLADGKERDEMRQHWRRVLGALSNFVEK